MRLFTRYARAKSVFRRCLIFGLLFASALSSDAAQITSGTIVFNSFRGNAPSTGNISVCIGQDPGGGCVHAPNFTIQGSVGLEIASAYIGDRIPFRGAVSIDPSGYLCGGGFGFYGQVGSGPGTIASFLSDCFQPYASQISGYVSTSPFLYAGADLAITQPFSMTLEVTPFMDPSNYHYLFTGSGNAYLWGHSIAPDDRSNIFVLDNYILQFNNVPEPSSAKMLLFGLAAIGLVVVLGSRISRQSE